MPGEHILVVENEQSGYVLPELVGAVAVFGGGRNLAWMEADWLQQKQIGYWGDMDSWGFLFLSEARQRQPHLTSLLMDRETLFLHQQRMIDAHPSSILSMCQCEIAINPRSTINRGSWVLIGR